uniref:Uncharacterized protein n=1 Tax=Oryza glumipatula TaxID=40148 RepID=A0A0D9YGC7_9ORYZ
MEAAVSQRLGEEVGEGDEPGQCQSTAAAAAAGERKRRPPRSSRVSLVPIFSNGRRKGGRTRRRPLRRTNHTPISLPCSFDKILRKEIPSQVVYEDEKFAFQNRGLKGGAGENHQGGAAQQRHYHREPFQN